MGIKLRIQIKNIGSLDSRLRIIVLKMSSL